MLSDDFFHITKKIYQDDPYYTPEDEGKIRWLLSPENPAWQTSEIFMECEPGKGRLVGFHQPDRVIDGKISAFFGFWETMNDPHYVKQVFQKFEAWAKGKGAQRIYGPIDFSTHNRYRLRFPDTTIKAPFTGEPYNPGYYLDLLQDQGYQVSEHYRTRVFKYRKLARLYNRFKIARKPLPKHLEIITLDTQTWHDKSDEIYHLIHNIFSKNFAYTKVSKEHFDQFITPAATRIMSPRASVLIWDKAQSKCAGMAIVMPNYASLTRQGAQSPINERELSYAEHMPLLHKPEVLGKTFGVMPEYRRLGLHNHLLFETGRRTKDYGKIVGFLAKTDNYSIRNIAVPSDVVSYGLFAKDL